MADTATYLSITRGIPGNWPVMIHDPGTGLLVRGGLVAHGGNLVIGPAPMTVAATREVAAGVPAGWILSADGSPADAGRQTEFVIEPDRERVVIGGWDWVTREYIRHGEKPAR